MLSERTFEVLENNDITIREREEHNDQYYREIEFCSPEGEDVVETIWYDGTDEGFKKSFEEHADMFNVDEHVGDYVDMRGKNGVPESVKDLVDDAEWIKKTLQGIAKELNSEEDLESLSVMNRRQFTEYINQYYDISEDAARLINNILCYVEAQGMAENEQYVTLCSLLDGTIGLTSDEIKKIFL